MIPIDEVVYFDVITSHPANFAPTDADSTPTFAVYEESTDTDIGVGGNLTKRTSLTGNYRGSFTASTANGFEAGKWYSIIASATVAGTAAKCVVSTFRCIVAEATAGVVKTDTNNTTAVADAVLSRNVSNVEASAASHSLCTVVLGQLESEIDGTDWDIYRTDGSTPYLTKTVATTPGADPITGVS